MTLYRFAGFALMLTALDGCNRHEVPRVQCEPLPQPDASAIALERAGLPPGTITGRVVGVVESDAPTQAVVSLQPGGGGTITGVDGRFRIDSLPLREYSLAVRRIGYEPARRELELTVHGGVHVLAALARSWSGTDACGTVVHGVTKPWWKLW